MGMPVITPCRSAGQFHFYSVLFVGCSRPMVPVCLPASQAASGVTKYLSHVAPSFILCQGESGMCDVLVEALFGFEGCVTICLCYKRQVG